MIRFVTPISTALDLRPNRSLRLIGIGLLAASILSCLLGLAAFSNNASAADGWLPYVGSTILFIAACYVLIPYKASAIALPRISRNIWIVLAVIVALGAAFRFYEFNSVPFGTWNDEAYIGSIASNILSDPTYRPIYIVAYSHPLHFYLLAALAMKAFGYGTAAIRSVSALFGLATIVVAFLAGREALGNRFGLIFAFLFAIARWHITFSRFGLFTITVPFFELLTIWLLLRARRTGQIHDYAWAGLALGYGLNFYLGIRLFVPIVLIFLVVWILVELFRKTPSAGLLGWKTRSLRSKFFTGLTAFGIGAVLAFAPMLEFIAAHPDQYFIRDDQVSIFAHRDDPNLMRAITNSTLKHLFMFNYQGDGNGRHNLSGEPMLDPATGALFVLGLVLALTRFRRPVHFLFLLVFTISLLGGILSLDFEAPQANRTFGSISAVLFFAALAVETVLIAFDRAQLTPAMKTLTIGALVVGLGGYATYYNANTYFGKQANDPRTWEEFNGMQSITAKRMLEADPAKTTIYASMYLNNHEVIRFLAPQVTDSQAIITPIGLPVREPGDRPVAIFVDPQNTWIIDEAHRYYPDAEFREDTSPNGSVVLYSVYISPEQIQRLQGATVQYWPGDSTAGNAAFTTNQKSIAADWTGQTPIALPFVARWETTLYAPNFGNYQFVVRAPEAATLWLDQQPVMAGAGEQTVTIQLAQGDHVLRIEAQGGNSPFELLWQPPDSPEAVPIPVQSLYLPSNVPVSGLLGTYYGNADWTPPAAFSRIDPFIDTYFHIIPLARPYSVDWSGQINTEAAGTWSFSLRINGIAQVFIDDQLVVDASETEPGENNLEGSITLTAGWHKIHIRYLDDRGASRLHLYWTPPGQERSIVPSSALIPYP